MGKIKVTHFQRKPLNGWSFSLEFIFKDVREILKEKVDFNVKIASFLSTGYISRIYNTLEAIFYQSEVNHITGDIHYVSLFLLKRKTILTILDCGFLNTNNLFKKKFLKFFWLTLPSKKVQYITAISEATKHEILKNVNFPPDKIFVIPVAVSKIYKPNYKEFNHQYPRILQIGNTPNKNIYRLAQALNGIKCKLIVVGKLGQEFCDVFKENKIDYELLFNLSPQEILQEYIKCDIVSFVSTYEGFGMPIVEANCVERVVITGNTSSMPEVAGDSACIVDPYSVEQISEGLKKIINDKEYRDILIENGKINKLRFSRETIANQYFSLYQKIRN